MLNYSAAELRVNKTFYISCFIDELSQNMPLFFRTRLNLAFYILLLPVRVCLLK